MALAWLTLVLALKPGLQGPQPCPVSEPSGQNWSPGHSPLTAGWGSSLYSKVRREGLLVWQMAPEEGRWGLWVCLGLGLGEIQGGDVHRVLQLCPETSWEGSSTAA